MFAAYNLLPGKKFLVTAPTTHSPWCSPEAANKSQAKEQDIFRALRAEAVKP